MSDFSESVCRHLEHGGQIVISTDMGQIAILNVFVKKHLEHSGPVKARRSVMGMSPAEKNTIAIIAIKTIITITTIITIIAIITIIVMIAMIAITTIITIIAIISLVMLLWSELSLKLPPPWLVVVAVSIIVISIDAISIGIVIKF